MRFLEMKHVSKSFGATRALVDVSLGVDRGQVRAIVGENGAGKSTLIKILTGVVQRDAGEIWLDGQLREFPTPAAARHAGIACVYQEPLIYPHLTALENMFLGREPRTPWGNVDRAAMRQKARETLQEMQVEADILDVPMGRLRLGHQQLVLIAQALIHRASLFIFDEPTSILSGHESAQLFRIIRALRDSGRAVLYISHRLEELAEIADEVTVITDGRVVGEGPIHSLSTRELVRLMAGGHLREYQAVERRAPERRGVPRLKVSNLTHRGAFQDVSLEVYPGEIVGLYGLVGAGRSEVALTVFGHLSRDAGRVEVDGQEIAPRSPEEAIRYGVGYVAEDRKLQGIFAGQTVSLNVPAVVLRHLVGRWGQVLQKEARTIVERFVKDLSIKVGSVDDGIETLSGGGQQKVVLARWMAEHAHGLKVLILDEPTRGIDVGTKEEIHRIIAELAGKGLGILVISSDLPEVLKVSDRVVVMARGRVAGVFSREETSPEAVLARALATAEEESA